MSPYAMNRIGCEAGARSGQGQRFRVRVCADADTGLGARTPVEPTGGAVLNERSSLQFSSVPKR